MQMYQNDITLLHVLLFVVDFVFSDSCHFAI